MRNGLGIETGFNLSQGKDMSKKKKEPVTVHGLIIPIEWDAKGNVITIALSTFDEDEYLIEQDEMGERLMSFLRQGISLSGSYRLRGGRKILRVTDYRLEGYSTLP